MKSDLREISTVVLSVSPSSVVETSIGFSEGVGVFCSLSNSDGLADSVVSGRALGVLGFLRGAP